VKQSFEMSINKKIASGEKALAMTFVMFLKYPLSIILSPVDFHIEFVKRSAPSAGQFVKAE